jgi:hypothetical protein
MILQALPSDNHIAGNRTPKAPPTGTDHFYDAIFE